MQANLVLEEEVARACRDLALELGFTITRGPGDGEIGSIPDLLRALAAAYAVDPTFTRDSLREILSLEKPGR